MSIINTNISHDNAAQHVRYSGIFNEHLLQISAQNCNTGSIIDDVTKIWRSFWNSRFNYSIHHIAYFT